MRKTRGRGPTRCVSLSREGTQISITTNELGEPVGPEAHKFISYLGILARDGNLAPLTYTDWRALPETNKEKMWEEVQVLGFVWLFFPFFAQNLFHIYMMTEKI